MIRFPCHCGYIFEVPDELAGRQLQCPQCRLLQDVPTHDELQTLRADGTYRLDESPVTHEADRFEDLRTAYSRGTTDRQGEEIDLRPTARQIAAAGTRTPPSDQGQSVAPKYDPETGELVRALELTGGADKRVNPADVPMARATLDYARQELNPRTSLFGPLWELLLPINIASIVFVLLAHIFLIAAIFALATGIFVAFPVAAVVGMGLLAHYGNVIEDLGPDERDDLPRFLRHFSIGEDVWHPFVRVMLALGSCYVPALWALAYLNVSAAPRQLTALALAAGGTVFFPAVLLTTITSGTILNLRPDRVIGVIVEIGPRYLYFVLVFAVAIVIYLTGIVLAAEHAIVLLMPRSRRLLLNLPMAYAALLAGIYLSHYFCWLLGTTYRAKHDQFPWVLQRHVRTGSRTIAPPAADRLLPRRSSAAHRAMGRAEDNDRLGGK